MSATRQKGGLTVREVAQRYLVYPAKVREWIRSGEFGAINTADVQCGKPPYVILPDHLDDFERKRRAETTVKVVPSVRRRKKNDVDYYPQ